MRSPGCRLATSETGSGFPLRVTFISMRGPSRSNEVLSARTTNGVASSSAATQRWRNKFRTAELLAELLAKQAAKLPRFPESIFSTVPQVGKCFFARQSAAEIVATDASQL